MITQNLAFLQPTPKLRRLILIQKISQDPKVSQQSLADTAGIAVSMTNNYLKELEQEKLIVKTGPNPRLMQYHLTDAGRAYYKDLVLTYAKETIELYKEAKISLSGLFGKLEQDGVQKVVFYCAGEAAEVAIHSLQNSSIRLAAIIDDDPGKQGTDFLGYPVISAEDSKSLDYDAIVVTTYDYLDVVLEKAEKLKKKGIQVVQI